MAEKVVCIKCGKDITDDAVFYDSDSKPYCAGCWTEGWGDELTETEVDAGKDIGKGIDECIL